MTKYLTVLDKNEIPLGYLSKAKFVEIRDRLNSETLLSFEIPFDVEETKHITLEGFVIDDVGQKYVIRSIEKSETDKRNLIVGCVHVFSELGFDYIDRTVELFGVDCLTAVSEALQGTEFTVGAVNVEGLHDIDLSEIYVLKALQDIRKKWDCDLWFDNRTVYLGQKGEDNNEEIRQGKNLKTIKEPTDSNKVITRLYVYGKDGLTIESVNNNVKYIDSPYINDYRRPKCGKIIFNDISDQNELKYEGEKYLSKNDTPNVSYQISFVELEKIGKEPTKISVGDTIAITHTKFGMNKLKTRAQEYIRYPFEPKLGSITLSSIVETSIDDLVNLKKDQKKTDEYINKRFKDTSNTLSTHASEITQNAEDITLKVSETDFNGDEITSRINMTSTTITIDASKIDLNGKVTFTHFDTTTQDTINGKADSSDLGALAGLDVVEKARLGTTVIDGGYISADLLLADRIVAGSLSTTAQIDVGTDALIGNFVYLGNRNTSGTTRGIDFDGGNTRIQTSGDGLLFDSLGDFLFARALKTNYSETGFCGIGARHDAATTGSVAGTGVNYRIGKTYTPSSVSLSATSYTASPNITNITSHGFWIWVNGTGVSGGYPYWRGYYTC